MIKALLLDLDETLCDTSGANNKALIDLGELLLRFYPALDKEDFCKRYVKGIYRELDERYSDLLLPIINEGQFRLDLISLILNDLGINEVDKEIPPQLQNCFDEARLRYFDFYPNIKQHLTAWRKQFTLVVITNGPEFSQVGKVNAVNLTEHVDHILIGGQEPEQKPAKSIFSKALSLANCSAKQAVHIGDSLTADIFGANQSNIASVWVSHHQKLPENSPAQPDYIVEHPSQLTHLIETKFSAQ